MALKTSFLRDSRGVILGTRVTGYADGSEQIRGKHGDLIGKVVPKAGAFGVVKNLNNEIVARTPDPGFLFGYSEGDDE